MYEILSFIQVPKFWKSIRQKFFEVDLKKFENFVKFFEKSKIFEKLDFNWNFLIFSIFENFRFFDFRKFSIEIQLFRKFSISKISDSF